MTCLTATTKALKEKAPLPSILATDTNGQRVSLDVRRGRRESSCSPCSGKPGQAECLLSRICTCQDGSKANQYITSLVRKQEPRSWLDLSSSESLRSCLATAFCPGIEEDSDSGDKFLARLVCGASESSALDQAHVLRGMGGKC